MLTNTTWKVVFCNQNLYSHKVLIRLEYHSVCPIVRIGTPHTLSRKLVCPPRNQRGGDTLACGRVRGRGPQFGRLEKKPSTLSPLCLFLEAFALCGRRLEGCPNTAARLAGWRRVIQQGVILYLWLWILPWQTTPLAPVQRLIYYSMYTKHRHELRHKRKAWPDTLVEPCLISAFAFCYAFSFF